MEKKKDDLEKVKEYIDRIYPGKSASATITVDNAEFWIEINDDFLKVSKDIMKLINTPKDPRRMDISELNIQLALGALTKEQLHLILIDKTFNATTLENACSCWTTYDTDVSNFPFVNPCLPSQALEFLASLVGKKSKWDLWSECQAIMLHPNAPKSLQELLYNKLTPAQQSGFSDENTDKVSATQVKRTLLNLKSLESEQDFVQIVLDKHPGQELEIIEFIEKKRQDYLNEQHRKKIVKMKNQIKKLRSKYTK